jgi:hypothetical protein
MSAARFDRQAGTIETIASELTPEGFLKAHGIVARTGVLYYRDARGNVSAELIPPEELFDDESLASLGGKPLTNDHPTEDGCHVLVSPDNATDHAKGTVGNDIRADRRVGFVRITLDAHDGTTIADIRERGKRQLSSGRTIDRLDEIAGVWDPRGQQYWTGPEAKGRRGIAFDRIQRGIRHNHVAVVTRGRAGGDCAIRVDSADAIEVEPPQPKGGPVMAKIRIDGAEYEVESGAAAAFTAHEQATKARLDGLENKHNATEAAKVKAEAERDALKVQADDLKARLDAIDPAALVAERLKLERSVAHLKIDGADALTDRELRVAAIKMIKADWADEGLTDEHVAIYFDAMIALTDATATKGDAGRGAVRGARLDAAPANDMAAKRAAYRAKFHYSNVTSKSQGGN